MFIKLTSTIGVPVYVNPEHVSVVVFHNKNQDHTVIYTVGVEDGFNVTETPEEILTLIKSSQP